MHYEIISHRQTRDREEAARHSLTVAELIEYLKELDQDAPIIVAGYDGNLYNAIDSWDGIELIEEGDE